MKNDAACNTPDDFAETLSLLTGHLELFIAAWEEAENPPSLIQFLPTDGSQQRLILNELVKVDLEYRWLRFNFPKRLHDYLAEFPILNDGREGLSADVIYEEFHIRKQAGFPVNPADYLTEFPAQAEELRCLLDLNEPHVSTVPFKPDHKKRLEQLKAGDQFDDFDLLAKLGQGAFAHVYLARQRSMHRLVALKISGDHGTEPQTLAQFDHDHIVRVYDQKSLAGEPLRLLYMQYLAGGTLQSVVQGVRSTPVAERDGRLLLKVVQRSLEDRGESRSVESPVVERLKSASWIDTVCWIGSRLASALDYAHAQGTLHRDIKPANVLLTADGVPKLADFNISFCSKLAGTTPAAYFGGSLAYMSPEQIEACNPSHSRQPESLDGRSDLFSLGVMLWELLTGARPFADQAPSGNWTTLLRQMAEQRRRGIEPEARKRLPPNCPVGLIAILERCLSPEREQRWKNGAELARQLELCRHPHAYRLIYPPAESIRSRLAPLAIPLIVLLAALPNVIAGAFNYFYNKTAIIGHLQSRYGVANANGIFESSQQVINSIAYPLGLGILAWMTWRVMRVIIRGEHSELVSEEELIQARRRALNLGNVAAIISACEWALAGIIYPLIIHALAGLMPASHYLHFFGSLIVCGLIAAAYPFFLVTFFSLRTIYPRLLQMHIGGADDAPQLDQLRKLTTFYLVLAATVPLFGVLAIRSADSGPTDPPRVSQFSELDQEYYDDWEEFPADVENRPGMEQPQQTPLPPVEPIAHTTVRPEIDIEGIALLTLAYVGLIGVILVYGLFVRPLHSDLQALADIMQRKT